MSGDGDMSKSVDTIARRLSDRAGIVTDENMENEELARITPVLEEEVTKNSAKQRDTEIQEKISLLTKQIKENEMEYREILSNSNTKEMPENPSESTERSDREVETEQPGQKDPVYMMEEQHPNSFESKMDSGEDSQAPLIQMDESNEEGTRCDPSTEQNQTETLQKIENQLNKANVILLQIHSSTTESASLSSHFSSHPSNPFDPNPSSTSAIQSWMNRNGVSPIVPEGDLSEHTRAIERKINRFISKVTHSSHSNTPLVFQPTSSPVQAQPLLPTESPQFLIASPVQSTESTEISGPLHAPNPMNRAKFVESRHSLKMDAQHEKSTSVQFHLERHRTLDKSEDGIPKRRNIQKVSRAMTNISSSSSYLHEKPAIETRKRPVRYVRRLGQRRIVAGATCQSCYLDGLDENGEVITSVQVRNVGLGMMRLKRREPANQGEELEEPRHRGVGLFGGEDDNENENEDEAGMEMFYDQELDVSELERELDRQIRQLRNPTQLHVCSQTRQPIISTVPRVPSTRIFIPLFILESSPVAPETQGTPNSFAITLP